MATMDKSFVWLFLLLLYKGSNGFPQSDLTVPSTGSVNILATGTDYSGFGQTRPAAIGGSAITTQLDIGQPSSGQFVVDLMNNQPASNSVSNVAVADFGGSVGASSGVNILGVPGSAPVGGNALSSNTQFVLTQPEFNVGLPPTQAPFELFQGESMSSRPPSSGISPDKQLIANMETGPYSPPTKDFGAFSPTDFNTQSLDSMSTLSSNFVTNPYFKTGSSNFDLTNSDRSIGQKNAPSTGTNSISEVIGTNNFPLPSFNPTSSIPTESGQNSNYEVLPDHAMDLPPSNNEFLIDQGVGSTNLNEPRAPSYNTLPKEIVTTDSSGTGSFPGHDSNLPISDSQRTLLDNGMDLPASPSTLPTNKYASALPHNVMDLLTLNPGVLNTGAMNQNTGTLENHAMDSAPHTSGTIPNHAQTLSPTPIGTLTQHDTIASPNNAMSVAPQGVETLPSQQGKLLDLSSIHRGHLPHQGTDMTMIDSGIPENSEGFPDISLGFGAQAPTTKPRYFSEPTVASPQPDAGSASQTVDHSTNSQTEPSPIPNNTVDLVIPSNRFVLEPTIDLTLPNLEVLPEHSLDVPTVHIGSIPDQYPDIPPRYINTTPRNTLNSNSPNTGISSEVPGNSVPTNTESLPSGSINVAPTNTESLPSGSINVASTKSESLPSGSINVASTNSETLSSGFINVAPTNPETLPSGSMNVAPTNSETLPSGSIINVTPTKPETLTSGSMNVASTNTETLSSGSINVAPTNPVTLPSSSINVAHTNPETLPSGSMNVATTNSVTLPSGSIYVAPTNSETLPSGSINEAPTNSETLPSGSINVAPTNPETLPSGSMNVAATNSENIPSGSVNVALINPETLPSGSMNVAATNSGTIPSGSVNVALTNPETLPSGSMELVPTNTESLPSGSVNVATTNPETLPRGSMNVAATNPETLPSGSVDVDPSKPETLPSTIGNVAPTNPETLPSGSVNVAPTNPESLPSGSIELAPTNPGTLTSGPMELAPTNPETLLSGSVKVTPTYSETLPSGSVGVDPSNSETLPSAIGNVAPTNSETLPSGSINVAPTNSETLTSGSIHVAPTNSETIPSGSVNVALTNPETLPSGSVDVAPTSPGTLPSGSVDVAPTNPETLPSGSVDVAPTNLETLPSGSINVAPINPETLPSGSLNVAPTNPKTLPSGSMDVTPTNPESLPSGSVDVAPTSPGTLPSGSVDVAPTNPETLPSGSVDVAPTNPETLPSGSINVAPINPETLPSGSLNVAPTNPETLPSGSMDVTPTNPESLPSGSMNVASTNPETLPSGSLNVAPTNPETLPSGSMDVTPTNPESLPSGSMNVASTTPETLPSGSMDVAPTNPKTSQSGSVDVAPTTPETLPTGFVNVASTKPETIPGGSVTVAPTSTETLPSSNVNVNPTNPGFMPEPDINQLPIENGGSSLGPIGVNELPTIQSLPMSPEMTDNTIDTTPTMVSNPAKVIAQNQISSGGNGIPSLPEPNGAASTANQGIGSTDRFGQNSSQPANTVRTTPQLPQNINNSGVNLTGQNVPQYQYGTQESTNTFTQQPNNVARPKDQIHFHPSQQILPSNPSPSSPKTIISEQYRQFLASRLPGNPVAPNPVANNPPSRMPYYPTSGAQQPPLDTRQYPKHSVNSQHTVLDPRQLYLQQLAQRARNDQQFQLHHQATYAATNKGPQMAVMPVLSAKQASNQTQWKQTLAEQQRKSPQPRPTPELTPNAAKLMEQIRDMSGGVVPDQSNLQAVQEAMKRLSLKSLPTGTKPDIKTPTNHSGSPQQPQNDSETSHNKFQNIPTQTARQPTIQQPSIAPNKVPNVVNPLSLDRNPKQQPSRVQNPQIKTSSDQQTNQATFVGYPQISETRVNLNHQDTHKSIYPPGSKNAEWAAYIQQNPGTARNSESRKRQQQAQEQARRNTPQTNQAGYQNPQQAYTRLTGANNPSLQQPRALPARVTQQIRQPQTVRQTDRTAATNTASQTNPQGTQIYAGNKATLPIVRNMAKQNVQPNAKNEASPINRQNELISKVSEIPGIDTRPQFQGQPLKTRGLLQNEAARRLPEGAAPYSGGGGGGNDMLMAMMMMNQMQGGEGMPMAKMMEMMNPNTKPTPTGPIQLATPAPKTLKEALGYYDPVMKEFIPRGAGYGPEIKPKPTTPPPVRRPQMTPQQQLQAQVQLMAKLRQNPNFAKMPSQMQAQNPLFGQVPSSQLGSRVGNQMMARLMAQQNQARNPQTGRPTPTNPLPSRELRQQPVTSHALQTRRKKSVDVVGKARLKAFEHIKRLPRDELLKEYSVWRIENSVETSKKSLRQFLKFLKGKIQTVAPLFVPQQPIM